MSKLWCRCGYGHDLAPIPDAGWLTVRDADYDRLLDAEHVCDELAARAGGTDSADFAAAEQSVADLTGLLYECPRCGRLLWKPPGAADFRCYSPEPPATTS
ncbi:MAG: hypothetical protein M3282_12380 [Gemmatimonadota bacterium]|jgi:hypothetical protein|nr:hypothetical protein [Gemmatimonadota bacterium]